MLTDEEIKKLWEKFAVRDWSQWQKDYLQFLIWARNAPESELRTESAQRKLWSARAIASAGQSENINVSSLLDDSNLVDAIVALRAKTWPSDTEARANALQAEF
ncbi:MAG TPA: ATP-binding protein, partial [Polyangium sp.]|nr:ATP-binding protein [Polyangium sp.]